VDWEDWLEADKSLLQKSPPLLRVNLQENTVLFGQRTIKLSKQEGKIIDALIDAGGRCSRDELATAVWGQHAAADDAMDQAVNRLRIKLGDNAANPIYLKTIRGQGFELTNYELA
jgi:DNA-binding winged helix-turn-helix (wHTH) protein